MPAIAVNGRQGLLNRDKLQGRHLLIITSSVLTYDCIHQTRSVEDNFYLHMIRDTGTMGEYEYHKLQVRYLLMISSSVPRCCGTGQQELIRLGLVSMPSVLFPDHPES